MTFRPELRRPKGPRIAPGAPRGRLTETWLRCGLCAAAETTPADLDRLDLSRWTHAEPWGLVHARCLSYAPERREAHPEPTGVRRQRRRRRDRGPGPLRTLTAPWDGPAWVRHRDGDTGCVLGLSARHARTLLVVLDPVPEERRVRSGRRVFVYRVPGRARRVWWPLEDCRPASIPSDDPGGPERLGSILSRL